MQDLDPLENLNIKRLQLFIYLVPIVGFFPAVWTLYRRQGTKQQRALSRLVITLALGWLFGYILLVWLGRSFRHLHQLQLPSSFLSLCCCLHRWL